MILLDGALGTELERRGVDLDGPGWSARALLEHAAVVGEVHAAYAAAGATVHTAATFRAQRRHRADWETLARRAVGVCRAAIPSEHAVFGSMAPLEDCWRPDLSPADPGPEHREMAFFLAQLDVDGLLLETFPHPGELEVATRAAVETGLPVWSSLTPGYRLDLLSPAALADGARQAWDAGASRVLINCAPAARSLPWVQALAATGLPFGVYANAGSPDERLGPAGDGPERYAEIARMWLDLGAEVIGGCCGTGPAHIQAVVRRLGPSKNTPRRRELT